MNCILYSFLHPSGRVYVCRTPKGAYNPECLVPTVKHGGGFVKVWAAISWYSVGSTVTDYGRITAREDVDRQGNQVHHMIQTLFPNISAIFQDYNTTMHTTRTVGSWFEEHEDQLHLSWTTQSPLLNIIEPLWSVLEIGVRNRFPPRISPKQVEDVLQEE
jgi:hypothetical protein